MCSFPRHTESLLLSCCQAEMASKKAEDRLAEVLAELNEFRFRETRGKLVADAAALASGSLGA